MATDVSQGGIGEPAQHAVAVTLHDTNEITVSRALWVGGAGDLKVTMLGGQEVVFVGIAAGTLLPIRAKVVWSTGSSASNVLNLY